MQRVDAKGENEVHKRIDERIAFGISQLEII
jgi:hypothetical protein